MQRGWLSSSFLIFFALVSAILPAGFFGLQAHTFYTSRGRYFHFAWPGLQEFSFGSPLAAYQFLHDRFQSAQHVPWFGVNGKIHINQCDPESGEGFDRPIPGVRTEFLAELKTDRQNRSSLFAVGGGDHLWLVDQDSPWSVYKYDGEKFIESNSLPVNLNARARGMNSGPVVCFELHGLLSVLVLQATGQHELFQLVDNDWQSLGEIELLDLARGWISKDGQTLVDPDPSSIPRPSNLLSTKKAAPGTAQNRFFGRSLRGSIRILTIGDTQHVFWELNDRLLHRRGLDLIQLISDRDSRSQTAPLDQILPVSALEPANAIGIAHGWTLVPRSDDKQLWFPVAVGNQPTVILCPRHDEPYRPVRALHLEQNEWTEFASTTLPFLSFPVIAGSRDDGSTAYLAVATRLGRTQVLALEPSGFRLTKFHHISKMPLAISGYFIVLIMLIWGLFFAPLIAFIAFLIMRTDRVEYEFGQQSVRKAGLTRRGLARLADLTLLFGTTAALFWSLQAILITEWQLIFEIRLAKLYDHPQAIMATRIIVGCVAWHCLAMLGLIALQGRSGATPGKWLFGLRTVHTTLRPPGFARSLTRELVLYAESAAFTCWAPVILFITYTQNRQRLGDLIADTIVIKTSRNS